MSVERRSTRRSTAENRIGSGEPIIDANMVADEKVVSIITELKVKSAVVLQARTGGRRKLSTVVRAENEENVVGKVKVSENNHIESKIIEVKTVIEETKILDNLKDEIVGGLEEMSAAGIENGVDEEEDDKGKEAVKLTEDEEPEAKMPKLDDEESVGSNGNTLDTEDVAAKTKKIKMIYTCAECDRKFTKKLMLIRHEKMHSAPRPFACTECDQTFTVSRSLQKHVKQIHEEAGELHPCYFKPCARGFITKSELEVHAETHVHEYKIYACRFCGKTFNKKFMMKVAIQASQDQGLDLCPFCNKGINPKAYSNN